MGIKSGAEGEVDYISLSGCPLFGPVFYLNVRWPTGDVCAYNGGPEDMEELRFMRPEDPRQRRLF